MDPFDPSRNIQPLNPYASSFLPSNQYPHQPTVAFIHDAPSTDDLHDSSFMKAPKRKRLAKACDACHKSKRRCDGTGPYYAAKTCTYTDASGRPVPAPRTGKPDKADPQPPNDPRQSPYSSTSQPRTYPPVSSTASSSSPTIPPDYTDDERYPPRKRPKNAREDHPDDLRIDGPIMGMNVDRPAPVGLDPALTRELTNLFFTHCHPARAIIHKPTFTADLSHNRVPSYLLHAICALAAPLSKQPRFRTNPPEALSIMFDGAGRLICEQNLATAQALCLLQMNDIITKEKNTPWSDRYHDLALAIVEKLGVHSPEHPTLTPVPSPEFIQASLEREAVRRIFWLIHLLDVMASIYFKKPITFSDQDLRLRLPVDETSFELGVHSTLPEYLYLPAVRIQWASEFGHLIRILTVYAKVELALDELNGRSTSEMDPHSKPTATLMEAEKEMEIWANSLPEHLRFSEQSLLVQQSMFETSSNTGAWCWCCMHVYHASCALALNMARHSNSLPGPPWALSTLDSILGLLGDRAKNSILSGFSLSFSLIKYCKRDDPQVRAWSTDYEEASGTQIFDIVQEWRPQPSPPQQHPYLHPTASSATLQPSQQSHELQPAHRRLPDVRGPVIAPLPSSGSRPSGHHHGSDTSYNTRRSPSSSPSSYPLGRSLDELRLHNSGNANNGRTHPDVPTRDARTGSTVSGGLASTHGGSEGLQKHNTYNEKENGVTGTIGNGVAVVNGAANSSAASGLAVSSRVIDGPQSLPSLKASGLLDSWTHGNGAPQRSPPRKSPPVPSSSLVGHDIDGRPATTLGAPVGLPWLANESR
ncbi:fungal-specific transcription factor domain-containing protein [Cyathus striatus]|nr:fungal-specific transcription factor domain-containing protein [Cyathus striatus]